MNTLHLQDVTYQILVSNFQFLKNNNEKYINLGFDFTKKYTFNGKSLINIVFFPRDICFTDKKYLPWNNIEPIAKSSLIEAL